MRKPEQAIFRILYPAFLFRCAVEDTLLMPPRKILICGDPLLRKKAARVRQMDDEVHALLDDMAETMLGARTGEQYALEGCLSLPTLQAEVRRPLKVVVTGLTPEEEEMRLEAEGLLARVLLHEIDHLDGILLTDRAEPDSLGWMIPDEEEEGGYRLEPTALEEVMEAFERLRQRQAAQEGSG
jgi:peptide deformylase